ncbi:TPA: hypothetical protein ACXIHA_004357 [Pseudomonas aeruginosa]|uniref:hypothetical protein n=1 Tax=Pseudomonas aeruginosa TaxID=287 RepID=UPI0013A5A326|nr:hypothetical protein [Pseudomonas aeruginosa]EJB8403594.1 hypothetical protein [Pseudomonas aeruginosa]EKJ6829943.1 hypothetical protein [Pseudomonas aeruginosa]MBH4020965.1 hypothetical protein [Pseudomonas aeruginosa]MBX5547866.1 hypothetical protein [Pseudomonas aeruginosa]MBX5723293.1 hypothetical protein [Pseudomonas aeruginosa]
MKASVARNHHFVSQAEQRLNAIDANVKRKNQRIYKFDILRREEPILKKSKPTGVRIEHNLSRMDLYTLNILESGEQHNFEQAFQKYENDCSRFTKTLLDGLESHGVDSFKSELLRLYALKLVNSIRSPYAVKRTLQMFRELDGVLPSAETLRAHFVSLEHGNRPQVAEICSEFGISKEEYLSWLKVIYLVILQPLNHGLNLIETLMKSLLENTNIIKSFYVYKYDKTSEGAGVLLSDRMIDQWPRLGTQIQMFNLDASSFMVVILVDIKNQDIVSLTPEDAGLDFKQRNLVHVDYSKNDLQALKGFNQHCVWLANSNVFCASDKPFGVEVQVEGDELST